MEIELQIKRCLEDKLKEAERLLSSCKTQLKIESGQSKLQKKIESEIKFFYRLIENPELIKDIKASNLSHLSTLLNCALTQKGVTDIIKPFNYIKEDGNMGRMVVDVVSNVGRTWIKVVARNPQALLQSSLGDGEYGRRTLLEQLKDMVDCASQNPFLYLPVQVCVYFSAGSLILPLKLLIQELGVEVLEARTQDNSLSQDNKLSCIPQGALLNLDVSTMIAYVSNLTNGYYKLRFQDSILSEQAHMEARIPLKPELDALFQGRALMCAQCALQDFLAILDTIGGFQEKERASQLISRMRVVPDQPSPQTDSLVIRSRIKLRPKIIFGTGDTYQAITVTSNAGFLRSAEAQGIKFPAYVHQSRALTEQKERGAMFVDI